METAKECRAVCDYEALAQRLFCKFLAMQCDVRRLERRVSVLEAAVRIVGETQEARV